MIDIEFDKTTGELVRYRLSMASLSVAYFFDYTLGDLESSASNEKEALEESTFRYSSIPYIIPYLAFSWRLGRGLVGHCAIPRCEAWVEDVLPRTHTVVWRHAIESTVDSERICEAFVKTRATAPIPSGFDPAFCESALFTVSNFADLVSLACSYIGDFHWDVCLYWLEDGRGDALSACLGDQRRPDPGAFLRTRERIIHTRCCNDMGFKDTVILLTKDDMEHELMAIASRYLADLNRAYACSHRVRTVRDHINLLVGLATGMFPGLEEP